MFKKMKNAFLKRQKASVAAEWVICAPFTLFITFTSIMMLIFILDFHLVSKSASSLVSELNMGDTGYINASNLGRKENKNITTRVYGFDSHGLGVSGAVKTITPKVTPDINGYFHNAAIHYINYQNNEGGFTAPYITLNELECRVYYPYPTERINFSVDKNSTESGDMIVVNVKFKFCGFIPVTIKSFGFID